MVSKYKRKTNRGSWSEESMLKAISAVLEGKMGTLKAAKTFSVPSTTLDRKIAIARKDNKIVIKQSLGPKTTVFSTEEEANLVEHLLDVEQRLGGLTGKAIRTLVYHFAVNNNITHPFNKDKREAGGDWTMRFLNRHPEISVKKPGNMSTENPLISDKHDLNRFYELLESMYEESTLKNATVPNASNDDKMSN